MTVDSRSPAPLRVQPDSIPAAMRAEDRWLLWRTEVRDGKTTKVPYQAKRPSRKASSTDASTWAPFKAAIAACGRADGIGFALGDLWFGIDLDHCAPGGILTDDAQQTIAQVPTYAEYSAFGEGVHLIGRGSLPPGQRKRGPVECYDAGRFFTMTGHRVPGAAADVVECAGAVATWHRRMFSDAESKPASSGNGHRRMTASVSHDDTTLLDRAKRARNGAAFSRLWAGDTSGYASHSEADAGLLAMLAFWTGRDPARMDRLFRASGLMREKWNGRRGATTWGEQEISRACSRCLETFAERETHDSERRPTPVPAADFWEPGPAFIERALAQSPPRMLIEGLLPADGFTLNHADPRSFKTWLNIAGGIGLTTGRPVGGYCRVASAVPVGYITNEDGARRIADRLTALLRGMGLSRVPDGFFFAVHRGVWLDDLEWQARLVTTARERGLRVLMLDPLRSLSACVDQGPRELQPFATWLRRFQNETGCAVWMSHHNTKPMVGQKDDRRRPHRASGGGLFSIADAPILLERIGETNRAIVTPGGWKFAQDPPALELELTVDGDAARVELRLAETAEAGDAAMQTRILDYLAENPGASGSRVAKGIRANKAEVLAALKTLCGSDRVDCVKTARQNQWFIRRSAAVVPAVPDGSGTGACSGSSGSPLRGDGTAEPVPAAGVGTGPEDGDVRL